MARRFLEYLKLPLDAWAIEYRVHSVQRMFKRYIENEDVAQLLSNGTIIEEYQDDLPFPSVLVNGVTDNHRPLHAVVGIDAELHRLYLITIYEPDPDKWSENFTKRVLP